MRFSGICLGVVGILAAGAAPALAGGIDNRTNWSAEYIRTLNRNAATDSADIAAYNPAGVMKMDNGTYINLSAQYVAKTYTNVVNGIDLESDEPSIVPGLFGIYKKDKWATYAAVTIPSGGGKVKFNNGNARTRIAGSTVINNGIATRITEEIIEGKSYYIGYTVGGAYAINDMVSISLAARYINASVELKGALSLSGGFNPSYVAEYEKTADGWGAIIGIDLAPTEKLNIGMRYETLTHLNFENKVTDLVSPSFLPPLLANEDPPIIDGMREKRDLPALLGLGVSHQCTPKFRVEADLTYYFNKNADWNGEENNAGNGYDVGLALEYKFNKKVKGSVGYMYTDVDQAAQFKLPENPALGASTVGAGFVYSPQPVLDLNFSVCKVFYEDASYIDTSMVVNPATDVFSSLPIQYKKDIIFLAFGIQYKFI